MTADENFRKTFSMNRSSVDLFDTASLGIDTVALPSTPVAVFYAFRDDGAAPGARARYTCAEKSRAIDGRGKHFVS